jgi:uncharacterized alpha-E superfamily protein
MRFESLPPVVLHEYLDQVQADLGDLHAALARQYFHLHHTPAPTQTMSQQA